MNIVHWKDVVGEENLETFLKVERAIIMAHKMELSEPVEVVRKKLNDDEAMEMWAEKRRYMRKCGYEVDRNIVRWLGWYAAYFDGNEVKFMTTANPNRKYISLRAFLDFRRNLEQDAIEDSYYRSKGIYGDDEFIPEEDDEEEKHDTGISAFG